MEGSICLFEELLRRRRRWVDAWIVVGKIREKSMSCEELVADVMF